MTERVLEYQRSREGLGAIVEDLAPAVYRFPRLRMGMDNDACSDFYVFVHPRLLRLLDRFSDQGKPFESYLWSVLNWQLKSFARARRRSERFWSLSYALEPGAPVESPEVMNGEQADPSLAELPAAVRCVRTDTDRRNFLFLALKCARLIDEENVVRIAEIAGITPESLRAMAEKLAEMRASRVNRVETFRYRRNKAYAQTLLLEDEMRDETDTSRREALEARLARERRKMQTAAHRMTRVALSPTNREVAELLGVPKGTVDSGIFWLKRKLSSVYDPGVLRTA